MTREARSGQSGFSLIELTVAMVVTLIVTGAIYGLLAGGQSAFRREPELSDRQQNIRVAMDVIMKDIASAGAGHPGGAGLHRGLDSSTGAPLARNLNRSPDELEMITSSLGLTTSRCASTPVPYQQ
jgi:prepilin-type N-terminal cleavage/methylation domain-containing protein